MDLKSLLEMTEASLLTSVGDELQKFFADRRFEYIPATEAHLAATDGKFYVKVEVSNAASAVQPMVRTNMVANVTFHLLAQQLALLFYQRKKIDRQKVYETTFDNIKRLTVHYILRMKEGNLDGKVDQPMGE